LKSENFRQHHFLLKLYDLLYQGTCLKEFDRRNDWFNQDNHDLYYDDDETHDGHFDESSDEIETYEGDDKEEHMFLGREGRIILKGSDADGNFLISKSTSLFLVLT
jgi:hypothetical protein